MFIKCIFQWNTGHEFCQINAINLIYEKYGNKFYKMYLEEFCLHFNKNMDEKKEDTFCTEKLKISYLLEHHLTRTVPFLDFFSNRSVSEMGKRCMHSYILTRGAGCFLFTLKNHTHLKNSDKVYTG